MMPDALPQCFRDRRSPPLPEMPNSRLSSSKSVQSSSKSVQNLVTCLYRTIITAQSHIVSVTWCKSLRGQGLSISFDYPVCKNTCSVDMKPWLFWKKQGSKSFDMGDKKIDMFWDLSSARYACGPEPHESFYVIVACNNEVILLLGDMHREALKKFPAPLPPSDSVLLSRKEHVYGKQLYTTKAQLCENGRTHDIAIECHHAASQRDASRLSVRVDKQTVIHVTGLMWKFRGNQTIQIDGIAVDVFWDVHNWLFKAEDGHAVFMFNTSVAQAKNRDSEAGLSCYICPPPPVATSADKPHYVSDGLWTSVLQWPTSGIKGHEKEQSFSLLLYAWHNE